MNSPPATISLEELKDFEKLKTLKITNRRLGEGGFGSVFVCKLGEIDVAAKKLSQSEKELTNLIRETSRLKRLRHGKHIAYTYGFTSNEGVLYMVMEYSKSGDLQNYLKKNKESVTYEQKILFCRGILLGLLYCHSMKIFHGDIKCSNVILGKNLEPKLTDFGLSMTVDNIEGYCKTYEGSIHWTAPELFSMEEESSFEEFKANPYPTDVYSLGATFCQVSFDGTTNFIDSDNIEMDISLGLVSPLPRDGFLEKIIDECCQFERNERMSLDKCLSMLDAVAEKQLPIPDIDDKWLGIRQGIKAKSKLELPPSFILYRPADNLVVGPSNLSLLEWLCINDCIEAVEYMIQLHGLDETRRKWLHNISVFCKSPDAARFLQSALQSNTPALLKLPKFIDLNPWQLVETFIKAGAKFDENGLLEKAIEKHYNKVVQLIAYNTHMRSPTIFHDAINFENAEAVRILVGRTSLELRDKNGDTPLLAAINAENVEIVKILLDNGANVHNKNDRSQHILKIGGQPTPLIKATVKRNHEIVELLINAGATIDTESSEWHSLIQDLEQQGKSTIIQRISNVMRRRARTVGKNHSVITPINNGYENKRSVEPTPLCIAIRNGQSDLIKKLIDDGADANEHDCDEYSPLHWAVIIGDEDITRTLLKAGADIDAMTPNQEQNFYSPSSSNYFNGYTPLHIAIVKRHLGIAKLLIESGANFSLKNKAGQTIMEMADNDDKKRIENIIQECFSVTEDSFQWVLKTMSTETVKTLISSRDASADTLNHFLCIAACCGNTEAINYLLEFGANANNEYEGKSPLEWAIFCGYAPIVQILIDYGTGIHNKGNEKHNSKGVIGTLNNCSSSKKDEASEAQGLPDTLLQQAAVLNNVEIVEILLNAGVDIDAKNDAGHNALYCAALRGCDEVVALLHEKGAKVRLWEKAEDSDTMYETAKYIAHKAAEAGKVNTEKIFTDAVVIEDFENTSSYIPSLTAMLNKNERMAGSSSINNALSNTNLDKVTALTEAVKNNQLKRVQLLLKAGVDINAKSVNSRTILIEYVDKSLIDVVRLLVEEGADVNARDKHGFAPIHYVKDRKITQTLISHGADINTKNMYGRTPLAECVNKSLIDIVHFLIGKGADVNARDNDGCTPIHFVKNKQIAEILITYGADINAKGVNGMTPLSVCVDDSLIDMVQFLIEKGADVNARDNNGCTPIHCAKNKQIAEFLITHGADINAKDIYGMTPLFLCVDYSLIDMVQFLIEKGADVNARNERGFAPIHYVKNKQIAEILITHGVDVNTRSKYGRTLLAACVNKSLTDIVQFLIEKGADVNARDERGFTPIHYARNKQIAEFLIAHGADINAKDIYGMTPLFVYVDDSLIDMVQFLIEKGADVNARDEVGYTPIYFVKDREIAEFLIAHGADINARKASGRTPLIEFVDESLIKFVDESLLDMVQFLIEKGADMNARDNDGCTPIHFVKNKQIAEFLIAHGADINAKNTDSRTPLFICVSASLLDMVQFLIEKGADVNARDNDGYTPIYFVKGRDVAEFLISHGADIHTRSADDRTPLIECVDESLVDIVQLLIGKGADVNARDKDGCTPIYFVKNKEIAEILITHGADINVKNANGRTPLFRCVEKSLIDMVQFLIEKGADVNARDKDGFAPIHFAKDREVAEILITYGADINAKSVNGRTPLFKYVNDSLIDMVQFLIGKGADMNARDNDGYALIHFIKDRKIAEILIFYGADITLKNNDGRIVFDILLEEQNNNLDSTIYKSKKVCELLEYLKTLK